MYRLLSYLLLIVIITGLHLSGAYRGWFVIGGLISGALLGFVLAEWAVMKEDCSEEYDIDLFDEN